MEVSFTFLGNADGNCRGSQTPYCLFSLSQGLTMLVLYESLEEASLNISTLGVRSKDQG